MFRFSSRRIVYQGGYMTQLTSSRSLLTLGGSFVLLCRLVVFFFLPPLQVHAANEPVSVWLTTPDQANLLTQQGNVTFSGTIRSNPTTITVNEGLTYQQMVGFGASLTDASAWLIYNKLSASQRTTLLNNLFSASSG